ncbi:hypothetical protein D9M72_421200 [compost metagenome]
MLHEAGGLDVVAVVQHEFDIVGRGVGGLAQLFGAHGAVGQRHRHGLALVVAEHQPVAAREARGFVGIAGELAHHLAFGQFDLADGDGEAQFFHEQFDLGRAVADLGRERVRVAVAALGGIAHRQQEAFIGARQVLQARGAAGGEGQRLARQVGRAGIAGGDLVGFDQLFRLEQAGHARHAGGQRLGRRRLQCRIAAGFEREVQQALRVVVGRPEDLPAGHVLERR